MKQKTTLIDSLNLRSLTLPGHLLEEHSDKPTPGSVAVVPEQPTLLDAFPPLQLLKTHES